MSNLLMNVYLKAEFLSMEGEDQRNRIYTNARDCKYPEIDVSEKIVIINLRFVKIFLQLLSTKESGLLSTRK